MIGAELSAFLQGGVSIHIATRNAELEPIGARVTAVTVDEDGTHVTAYLAEVGAGAILADLAANGQAALGFGRPSDDRACQIKGTFVAARPAAGHERTIVERQWGAFLADLGQVGIPRQIAEGWHTWPSVAIRLRVTALFNQTPGPGTGAPMP